MSKMPDQTEKLIRRIAGQYIPDDDAAEMAVEDVGSFLAAFGAFVDFQGINSPSGFRALGNFFLMWQDNRKKSMAKKRKQSEEDLDRIDAELESPVTCIECGEDKPKVETHATKDDKHICFSCRPLFAVK